MNAHGRQTGMVYSRKKSNENIIDLINNLNFFSIRSLDFLKSHEDFGIVRSALAGYFITFVSCSTGKDTDVQTDTPESIAEQIWQISERKSWAFAPIAPSNGHNIYNRYLFFKYFKYQAFNIIKKLSPIQYADYIKNLLQTALTTQNYQELFSCFLAIEKNTTTVPNPPYIFEIISSNQEIQNYCKQLIAKEPRFKILKSIYMGIDTDN